MNSTHSGSSKVTSRGVQEHTHELSEQDVSEREMARAFVSSDDTTRLENESPLEW